MPLNEDFEKAMEFFNADKFRLALKRFNKAVDANPDEFMPIFLRGVCYFELDETEEAHKNFTRAKELDPENTNNLHYCGKTNLGLGNYDDAIEDLERAKENPDLEKEVKELLANAYLDRSDSRFAKKDFEAAEKDAIAAFENNAQDSLIWLQLGNIYAQWENFEKSTEYFREGSLLDPTAGIFHHNMGSNYANLGDRPTAIRCWEKAKELGYEFEEKDRAF